MYFHIIDRRNNPKDKSLPNRQRFIRRHQKQISDGLKDVLDHRSVTDDSEAEVSIDGTEEPSIQYDYDTGTWDYVLPGNREYVPGDKIPKPPRGRRGQGEGSAGKGKSTDDFKFKLSKKEYLDVIFNGLELPDMVKKSEKAAVAYESHRAGYTTTGPSSALSLITTMKNSIGRRIGLSGSLRAEIEELREELEREENAELRARLDALLAKKHAFAFIDPIDLRFRRYERVPVPNSRALMFCIMDVSGSMGESEKNVVKRFFLLLYLFLTTKYEKVEIVFIRHTDEAEEVDEDTFFHSQESGGTVISSALDLTLSILRDPSRYDPSTWNIYAVQASDGDNDASDNEACAKILEKLLPLIQYYVYTEVRLRPSSGATAMNAMEKLASSHSNLNPIVLDGESDVIPKFRKVFAAGKKVTK